MPYSFAAFQISETCSISVGNKIARGRKAAVENISLLALSNANSEASTSRSSGSWVRGYSVS